MANGRKTKNFIPAIMHDGNLITDQHDKEEIFFQTYKDLLGTARGRKNTLDLDFLGIQPIDLLDQDVYFTEEEVWDTIKDMPADCAPGPDGFIGLFFQKACNIIKGDLPAAIHHLFLGNGRGFGRLNQALITLIPKKAGACRVGDFRPISLVHSFPRSAPSYLQIDCGHA